MVGRVYEKLRSEGPFDRVTVSEALGHRSAMSGTVGLKIGSLTHFGLLERISRGLKISGLAKQILIPRDEGEKREAMAEAAKKPSLYMELCEEFEGKALPELLPNILARQYGVSPGNAKEVAKVFRETLESAGLLQHGVLYARPLDETRREEPGADTLGAQGQDTGARTGGSEEGVIEVTSARSGFTIPLSGARVAVLSLPVPVAAADIERIKGWIDLMREVLVESKAADSGADGG